MSDSPGLHVVDFAIGLVINFLFLKLFSGEIQISILLIKKGFVSYSSWNDLWASACYLQLAQTAGCKTDFLCILLLAQYLHKYLVHKKPPLSIFHLFFAKALLNVNSVMPGFNIAHSLISWKLPTIDLSLDVQKVVYTIHQINLYPLNSAICFPNTYALNSDLFGG